MKHSILAIIIILMLLGSSFAFSASSIPTAIYSEDTVIEEINNDDWHFYKIEVDNPAKLTVKLRKISDDVDLYVSRSKKPSEDEFNCAPLKTGSSIETCRLTSNTATTWYIGIHGKMDGDYQLSVKTIDLNLLSLIGN